MRGRLLLVGIFLSIFANLGDAKAAWVERPYAGECSSSTHQYLQGCSAITWFFNEETGEVLLCDATSAYSQMPEHHPDTPDWLPAQQVRCSKGGIPHSGRLTFSPTFGAPAVSVPPREDSDHRGWRVWPYTFFVLDETARTVRHCHARSRSTQNPNVSGLTCSPPYSF